MKKTWNVTLYNDGKPVGERRGVSHEDAVAQIYHLSHGTTPIEAIREVEAPRLLDTRELALAAA
jgi:hypothetical protein